MISINLMPETVIRVQSARRRARSVFRVACVVIALVAGLACGSAVLRWLGEDSHGQAKQVMAEVQSLREILQRRRRDVQQQEQRIGGLEALRVSQQEIARRLVDIPDLLPPYATLSSLEITKHELLLVGVASERAVVGDLVGNLHAQVDCGSVSVQRLRDLTIGRHTLQEFQVREMKISTGVGRAGIAGTHEAGRE